MRNYKQLIPFAALLLTGCDGDNHFFHSIDAHTENETIEYATVHQLNLSISNINKEINDSGFSPVMLTSFTLSNNTSPPWPHSWITFTINMYMGDKQVSTLTMSESLQNGRLEVSIDQTLPKFGIKPGEVRMEVLPVSWTPAYPLSIK